MAMLRDMSALQTAFRGCGMTMSQAHRAAGMPIGNAVATLDLLGQLLMVHGAKCLPGPTRICSVSMADHARSWPTLSAEVQLDGLKFFMGMLHKPPVWRKISTLPVAQRPMLPREMGDWRSTNDLPSCLGMLVILASYGYLTGAPMLAASVQQMSAAPVAHGMEVLYKGAHRFISQTLPLAARDDDLPSWLLEAAAKAIESQQMMLTRREFHGAVVIRLKDGRWISLDPYFQNMAFLNQPIDRVASQLIADGSAVATTQGPVSWDAQSGLASAFETLRTLMSALMRQSGRKVSLLQLAGQVQELAAKHSRGEAFDVDALLCRAVIPRHAKALPDPAAVREMVAAAENGPQREAVRQRILLGMLREWAADVWNAAQRSRMNQPHQSMLLSAPKRMLSTWTILNLRHRQSAELRTIDLLPYSSSDAILYGALVDHRAGRTTSEDRLLIQKRVEAYRQSSSHLLHPLILEALEW